MNRKIRVIILTMVLTVLMFGGTRLMAQDNLDVNTKEASQTVTPKNEGKVEPMANGDKEAPLVDNTEENTESDAIDAKDSEETDMGGVTNPDNEGETPDANQNDKAGDENADKAKDAAKGDANGEKADTPKESGEAKAEEGKDTDAQKSLEENKESAKGNGAEDGAAPAKAPEAPAGEGEEKTGEDEEPKQEVNPDANPDLKALQDQIDAEKDPKKKAELQKKYNDKYLEEIGKSEKLDKDILNRFTDKDRTQRYYELKDEYDKLAAQAKNEKLSQKQLDEIKAKLDTLNKELGEYKVPRKLDTDEKGAQDKLAESVDVPGLQAGATQDAEAKLKAYNDAKKALKDALDPEKARTTTAEELKKLLEDFDKAEKELKDGIKDGSITPKYTNGEPTVKVFPLDSSGKVGDELDRKDNTYYIPDNTDINLLVHVSKDDEPKDFTFTIKALDKGAEIKGEEAKNLAFLNGNPVELKKNEDGSYSFTVSSANMNFGIAQLRFNVPGFKAAFHNGFDLEMDLGNNNKVTKQFRITKKGYEDDAKIDGKGSDTDKNPKDIPEIDAGKTENAIVDKDTDKVFDFFTYLKKSNTYIDQVTFNSGNGESLPLNSVDITITVPKSGESNFAEMIHKSGLEYYDLGNGKYQLKLKTKVFGGNLTKTEDGKLMYNNQELTAANLKDVVLENAGKKVYVDKDGKAHNIITSEVLADKNGNYKVENGKLYKKNNENPSKFDEIGTFDKDGKIKTNDKIYVLDGNKLITYTNEYDVYDGYVANKDGKADPDVTPTYKGNQVTIETEVTKDGKKTTETSYGGTIVKDAKYDKNGKIFNDNTYEGVAGDQVIDSTGKKSTVSSKGKQLTEVKDDNGKLLYKYFVGDDGETYRIVNNAVFKGDYIVDGLEYNDGLSLIDKFGKKMNVEVSKNGETYTFKRKVKVGDKETEEKKTTGKDGENRTIKVSTDKDGQILVNSKNEVIANTGNKYTIVGNKYYYDGEKFVEAKGDGLKGNKFLADYTPTDLNKTIKNYYKDDDKVVEITDLDKKTKYEGSLNPEDYYIVGDKVYVKKGDIYISANPNESSEILTEKTIAKIVQFLGNGDDAIQKVTDETDIFNAIKNAKFALRFPGFLAGKNVVYNVHADIKATYLAPDLKNEGQFIEKSIFISETGEEKDKTKKIDKFFTLKNEKKTNTKFFKDAPDELTKDPAVNLHFFNIFYRNADDRQRDQLIIDLLDTEAKAEEAKKAIENANGEDAKKDAQAKYDKLVKENKEKLALIAKFKKELARLYNGATFDTEEQNNKKTLIIKDKDGNKIEANELNKMRSLLWEVGFNNEEGSLFPENKDTEIIIEDNNMDNRLIYDEIIVNDTKEKWDEYKKAFEEKSENEGKKFGNEEYFFLDQIKDIRFGVSPNYIEGRFVPLGENFKITGKEIIEAIANKDQGTIEKNGIKFLITRDKVNGQVRIKVMNAFYKKVENDDTHKFESPVQKAYQDKINSLLEKVENLDEKSIEDFVKSLHTKDTECFGIITKMLKEEFKKVKDDATKLDAFKTKLIAEVEKIKLGYLDSKKNDGNYKYDDMRFNAIRIGLNPNITIGGALTPQNIKKLGITSVIVPDIDIPYTDEFGNPLTNKDMYVKAEIENILKNGIGEDANKKTYKKDDLKNEEKFREIMKEAYKRVNDKIDKKEIEIKNLVTIEEANKKKVGMEKYTVTKGSELDYKDLAVNDQSLKNKNGYAINPWYIGEDDNAKSVEKRFEEKFGKGKYENKDEYKALRDMPIDIAAYYMSKQGYDRGRYANQASYKLSGGDKKDGIFGSDSDWHKKICYPGIGYCIEQAGGDQTPGTNPEEGKFGTEGKNGADFELTYEPTNDGPDKENPKVDKKTEDKDKTVDISGEDEKSVDFTIDVTVDKMTKEQKDIADALTPDYDKEMTEEEKAKAEAEANEAKKHYNEKTGYYEYDNSLIIDILPEIFKLKDGTKLSFEANREKLMANGANKDFADEKEFEKWQKGIEYFYTDDLEAEYKRLSKSSDKVDKEKAEVLKKAIEDARANGKIKEGQKVQAVLAWIPKFEAPHGSENQFTFKLSNVFVDKKKYKDFKDNVIGTNYTNDAAFGDKAKFYFGSTTVNIYEDHKGKVNKYLQVLDKDGNVIDKDKADGWFMGGTELKFGDKFNYRIEHFNNTGVIDVPGTANNKSEIKIEDIFAKVTDNGLKPVLRDYITSDLEQYSVIYKIGDKSYSEEELKKAVADKKVKLSDVTSVILEGKFENGATNHFDIPMMIPQIDAKIDDKGDVYYTGEDGDKKVIGKAEDFFNLKDLTDKEKELIAKNTVKDSNTVTVYLEKERFIRVFKEFLAANGEKLKDLNNLEAKFDVYQIIKDENGNVIKKEKVGELKANKDNDFTDMLDHLPIFKKTTTVDKDGKVKVDEVKYEYVLEEAAMPGFESKVYKIDDDKLGFVWQATNTEKPEKPEYPGDNPKKETEEVTVSISVNKAWEVLNNGSKPSIQVELYANGKSTGKIIDLGNGNWTATFKDLPVKDNDGNKIIYTVVEVGSENNITMIGDRKFEVIYSTNEDGSITILNKEVPKEEEKDKEEPKKDEPHDDENDRDRDQGKNRLPKTGVAEDLASIYFAFVLLLGLVFIKKRYLVK
ncbi:Cna B-type domain-containing protein [Fenollaria timonensis]|uniref:Cna B-type domain-containing protein n=1 Tax=Fenollaria timonensis TaxID=1723384 RepID=UPI0026E9971C|nr:Cna B-type domain-containing protein [Fenollaria timonensis]